MCGIIGLALKNKLEELELIKKGLDLLKHRGEDGYGFVGKYKNELIIYKALEKDIFLKKIEKYYKDKKAFDFVLIHNRKKSLGKTDLRMTHPVGKNGVYVVQNGTSSRLAIGSKSDTFGIYLLQITDELEPEDLEGAGVVFIFDKRNKLKIFFHRDKTRPLYKNQEGTIISSEPITSGKWSVIKETTLHKINGFNDLEVDESNSYYVEDPLVRFCDYCGDRGIIIETKNYHTRCANCYAETELYIKKRKYYYSNSKIEGGIYGNNNWIRN